MPCGFFYKVDEFINLFKPPDRMFLSLAEKPIIIDCSSAPGNLIQSATVDHTGNGLVCVLKTPPLGQYFLNMKTQRQFRKPVSLWHCPLLLFSFSTAMPPLVLPELILGLVSLRSSALPFLQRAIRAIYPIGYKI